jgi:hypothetical protein
MFMPFSCGTKDSDYSISDSLEPDLNTALSLHTTTLYMPGSRSLPGQRLQFTLT